MWEVRLQGVEEAREGQVCSKHKTRNKEYSLPSRQTSTLKSLSHSVLNDK